MGFDIAKNHGFNVHGFNVDLDNCNNTSHSTHSEWYFELSKCFYLIFQICCLVVIYVLI